MNARLFDREAHRYDAWYDTAEGSALYQAELVTLCPLVTESSSPRLEVGVGSGRFAAELGIEYGVDVAVEPLLIARAREVQVAVAAGEALPFRDRVFGSVVFVFTLCFVDDPQQVVREARRVLAPGGTLILGVVPADGPLGRHYQRLGEEGHRIYRHATFYSRDDLAALLDSADLVRERARSALFRVTESKIEAGDVVAGHHPDAGFLVISARKPATSASA
jgi:SAM-dependent methyltransferase